MTFKPGDILFWEEFDQEILLVLEVDKKYEEYKVFVLSSSLKYHTGTIRWYHLIFSATCHLKDKDL